MSRDDSAVDLAARALARRDRSEAAVRRILEDKGVPEHEADAALETLRRVGAVDDERFARDSAETLAARGFGDQAIVYRLEREGIDRSLANEAVSTLQPEAARAALQVERRGIGPRTARWLASRGFSAESIEHAASSVADTGAAELG